MKQAILFGICAIGVLVLFTLIESMVHARDAELLYVGDCVDTMGDADGHNGSPRELWDTYAKTCQERYLSR